MRHRRRQTSKLTALTLIPIIALAIIGLTYSHWQENQLERGGLSLTT